MVAPAAAVPRAEDVRRRQLVVTKRRATALLVAASVVFVVSTAWGAAASWVGYVQATAAASMVGGLADWFAVTALFRRPLGLPIPHTAIVVERKDQFAATLGQFIQESFLTPDVIVARVRAAGAVPRAADWLSDPANASRVAAEVADAAVASADLLRDDDVHQAIEGVLRSRVESVPVAPLAGRVLRFLTRDGRHDDMLDKGLRALNRYVEEHRDDLRRRLGKKSPWWVPGVVDHKLFDRALDGVRSALSEMADDHDHDLRRQLNSRLARLADDLESSPGLRARGEQLKHDLLAQPEVQGWVAALWIDVKEQLRAQASQPASALRQRLAIAVAGAGRGLREPETAARVEAALESVVCYVAEHFNGEIAGLVSGTVARWDAEETASRLELLLGPDLQYVRINGTVVGAGAGLLLHVAARVVG
jgi:uncharacterized membrane-anchored protein YjiN (DUF445 family)